MPNTVLIATAMSAISAVILKACTASGALIASQNAPAPSAIVRWNTSASGTATRMPM